MRPRPESAPRHPGVGKLQDRVALITGGDSGIGRAVAHAFAREGADVAIVYLEEREDARETCRSVESEGRRCLPIQMELGDEQSAREVRDRVMGEFGRLDILVNNAAEQHPAESLLDITSEMLERTFRTNILAIFYLTKAVLPDLHEGASIINTTSVNAYKGNATLIDYTATKGAIVGFTRSLALSLADAGIRVNGVAPGPIWTPLIPSTFDAGHVDRFGSNVPLGRMGQPDEVAPSYVFLASDDSSYITGQVLHPNGGVIVNG